MKPVLDDRRQLEPRRLQAVGGREEHAGAERRRRAAAAAARGASRHANGASTSVEIAKRTARNANSG